LEKIRFSFFLSLFLLWLGIFLCHSLLFPAQGPKESRQNLILVTVDTLRADRLSCYSPEHLSTPNIDQLAEKGILFTKTFAHTSTTLPSLTNILLGVTPLYHGVHDNASFVVREKFLTLISSLINAGEYDEAIKVFNENSLPKIANDPEIWNSIGVGYSKKGDFEKSIDFYEKALALDHDYPKAFNNLGSAYISIFLKTKNSRAFQKSIENFKKAIELDPNYASAYNGLGAAYLQEGNLEGAVSCLEKALSLDPDEGQAIYNLGLAYMGKGDNSRAYDYFNKLMMKYSNSLSFSEKKKLES
jgi:Flp pilus assembly protein TadD